MEILSRLKDSARMFLCAYKGMIFWFSCMCYLWEVVTWFWVLSGLASWESLIGISRISQWSSIMEASRCCYMVLTLQTVLKSKMRSNSSKNLLGKV